MRAHAGESRPQQRRIHVITGETAMSSAKAEPYAKRKLGLVTGIATLCMIPLADAAAQGGGRQISAGRAAAIHECSVLASDIRSTTGAMSKSINIGPAWRDMANKNNWQRALTEIDRKSK